MPTLTVTVGDRDRLDRETRNRIEAAQEGAELDDTQPVLNVDSYAELSRLLSPKNLELLETIAAESPPSISAAAAAVERDYKQVHRNLTELADAGVVEFDDSESGQGRRPMLAYDGLEVDIPFDHTDGRVDTAAP